MKLKTILVNQLFGCYQYKLNLIDPKKSYVTIIDAPNGMGKTTILKLIQAIMKCDIKYIDSIPFKTIKLIFDDDQSIEVQKKDIFISVIESDIRAIRNLYVHKNTIDKNDSVDIFENISYIINDKTFGISVQKDLLFSVIRRFRAHMDGYEEGKLSDVLFLDTYSSEEIFSVDDVSNELTSFTKQMEIYFIKTDRLYRKDEKNNYREDKIRGRFDNRSKYTSSVLFYKEALKEQISDVGKIFGIKSQELDRDFPQRVLDIIFNKNNNIIEIYEKDKIIKLLKELEFKRNELSNLGLITGGKDFLIKINEDDDLSRETRIFLSVYINDNRKKLEVFEELTKKLSLLKDIVNERNVFTDKLMVFDPEEGVKFISPRNKREIPIDKLSSGEKNNFILFYELIFECGNNSLILVDEPEISLHVAWQTQFIDELNDICGLKNLQGVVATHSPDIVGRNDDFMVDLEDVENG